jgi:hypothetical protein
VATWSFLSSLIVMEELVFTSSGDEVYMGKSPSADKINETVRAMRALKRAHLGVGRLVAIIDEFQIVME